jgi:hypothetical protein
VQKIGPVIHRAIFISDLYPGFPGCGPTDFHTSFYSISCGFSGPPGGVIDTGRAQLAVLLPRLFNPTRRSTIGYQKGKEQKKTRTA